MILQVSKKEVDLHLPRAWFDLLWTERDWRVFPSRAAYVGREVQLPCSRSCRTHRPQVLQRGAGFQRASPRVGSRQLQLEL